MKVAHLPGGAVYIVGPIENFKKGDRVIMPEFLVDPRDSYVPRVPKIPASWRAQIDLTATLEELDVLMETLETLPINVRTRRRIRRALEAEIRTRWTTAHRRWEAGEAYTRTREEEHNRLHKLMSPLITI